jgi:hypothetical protein
LVSERSADFSQLSAEKNRVLHVNSYPEYPRINHTYLAKSQAVAGIIVRWLAETAGLDKTRSRTLPGNIPRELGARVDDAFDPSTLEQKERSGTPI